MNDAFTLVGARAEEAAAPVGGQKKRRPSAALVWLVLLVSGCALGALLLKKDPGYMDLANCNVPPCRAFWFGTDSMGRDLFAMIWSGGRLSLTIGLLSTLLSTAIAILFGSLSGCAGPRTDAALMRLAELLLSVPNLLAVVLLQALFGKASVWSLSLVIGLTSWAGVAKVVRAEVRVLKKSEYVLAAQCMGGSFFHVLRVHLTPNFFSAISFMVVMNIRSAILAESTLSFMGLGLPLEVVSWGSMLSLAEKALLTGSWWVIVIPGLFLIATLLSITELANRVRRSAERLQSNL